MYIICLVLLTFCLLIFLLYYSSSLTFQLPKNPNSVVSSSYNHSGQLLAVASSCTYQEGNEKLVIVFSSTTFLFWSINFISPYVTLSIATYAIF